MDQLVQGDFDGQVVMQCSTTNISGYEMGGDSSINVDNSRANWTPSQDEYFLQLLLSHVHKGNKTGKVFSRQSWVDMVDQFNPKFGFKYDVDVLKNRYKRFKKQYYEIKTIVSQNGFHWDGALNMITADDKTWDEYIKIHPDARAFRTRLVPHYNDLCIIYGHAVADGRYSLSCFDVDFEYGETASKEMEDHTSTSKGVDDQTPPTNTLSKIDWSPMMDRFFVELMLDQVRKGNKIGRTFEKKAWIDMIESFNDRFGSNYGKVVLKNRLNVLRRHYCSINALLGKEGFSWDKTQHKVVADDKVWQKCIRVHHKFRLYRIKSMPFYLGMSIICRDEATASGNSNPENRSFKGKNSFPDPYAALQIGGETHFSTDTEPLPNTDNEVSEKNSTRETQLVPNADYEGGENNCTRETLPLPNCEGGENNCTIETLPLPNADCEGGENNLTRESLALPNADNEGGEKNGTRETFPLPNADKEGGEKNSTRETLPLPNADDEAVPLSVRKNVSGQQKRRQTKTTPPTSNEAKKARKSNEGMTVAVKHMAVAVTSLTKKTKKEDKFCVDNVISELQAIPGLDDDLILDAIDFLEDEKRARMFLALDANLRKKWLFRKLRSS